MKNIINYIILTLALAACGHDAGSSNTTGPTTGCDQACENTKKIDALQAQVLELAGSQTQLQNLVNSDFSTCPASGDTADPLVNKICKVAQASNVEAQTALKEQLASYLSMLKAQIDSVNNDVLSAQTTEAADVSTINAQITAINTQISAINTSLTSLGTRMTSAESAITALQTLTNSINATLNGTMVALDIGSENVAAGPMYETVLRRVDKARINAYVEAKATSKAISNNGVTATNSSPALSIIATAHGLAAGDTVYLSGLVGSRGFTSADLTGHFTVSSITDANTFTVLAPRAATSGGTLGGSVGTVAKVLGYGLATVWQTASGADAAVRTTTLGAQAYNFIVKADGSICYDKTVAAQTFATITAAGSNIVCK